MKIKYYSIFLLLVFACSKRDKPLQNLSLTWTSYRGGALDSELIHVYEGINKRIPIKAYYAEVDLKNENINVEVVLGEDKDLKETPSDIASRLNACLVVNAGYFLMNKNPAKHVGLLQTKNTIVSNPLWTVIRNNSRYYTTRGTVGFNKNSMDISWISGKNDSIYFFDLPHKNSEKELPTKLTLKDGHPWEFTSSVSGGPILVQNSNIFITDKEEVFFGTKIPGVHPRTAVGYTKDNKMIVLVVDGRQATSRGVFLEELAQLMLDLGCVEALNLDGGGSSALVVQNKLINKPLGTYSEREVMSAIAVSCD